MSDDTLRPAKDRSPRRVLLYILLFFLALIFIAFSIVAFKLYSLRRIAESEIALIRAAGDPLTPADLTPEPLPDSENGALDIEAAIALLPELSDADKKALIDFRSSPDVPPTPQEIAAARRILALYRPSLDRAAPGLAKPSFAFSVSRVSSDMQVCIDFYSGLRSLARAMRLEASLAARDSHGDVAASRALDLFTLASTLDTDPASLSRRVQLALLHIAISSASDTLSHAPVSPGLLRELSARCAARSRSLCADYAATLKDERARLLYLSHFIKAGDLRGIEDALGPDAAPERSPRRFFTAPLATANEAHFLPVIREWIEILEDPSTAVTPDSWSPPPAPSYAYLSSMLLQSISRSLGKLPAEEARLRTAAVALEVAARLAEDAAPPADLSSFPADLHTDPFTGTPLLVKSDTSSWTVYSVGPDLKDDSASPASPASDDISFTIPLIAPSAPDSPE